MSVRIVNHSDKVMTQMERNIAKTLISIGIKWQENATEEANNMGVVDSGRFRASLSYTTAERDSGRNPFAPSAEETVRLHPNDTLRGGAPENTVIVGSNVEYAQYLELGSLGRKARPTVGNAVQNYKDDYKEIVKRTLGEGFSVNNPADVSHSRARDENTGYWL